MIGDADKVDVDEQVVLQKFEGDALPENEFERLTISNGVVTEHNKVENGEVVGPVEDSEIIGKDVGKMMSQNNSEGG